MINGNKSNGFKNCFVSCPDFLIVLWFGLSPTKYANSTYYSCTDTIPPTFFFFLLTVKKNYFDGIPNANFYVSFFKATDFK